MIKNYFKIAFRNFKRYAAHSILNISGMAIGMTCAILILLWVQDEWSYDRHFKNADNLYRIIEKQNSSGGEISLLVPTRDALATSLKEEYPEIIRSSRYTNPYFSLQKGDELIEEKVAQVDKDFLKMFDIKFVRGNINSALNDAHDIILTEEIALKYFGDEDPIGKTLTSTNQKITFTITGVVKSLPQNSHIKFDILSAIEWNGVHRNKWMDRSYIYIELKEGTDSKTVDKKIVDFIKKHDKGSNSEIFLQNIKKIHLFSAKKFVYDISGQGDIAYVRILSLVAVFILLIACINFMNLSTAQYSKRSREIGVRKVAGANKRKIAVQFLGETLLIVFAAHAIAMIFVELMLPGFNNLTGKQLHVNYQSAGLYIGLITVVLFCGLLAGSYPAFYLSSLKPLNIMKGTIDKSPGNTKFRRVLVIFQFSLSALLIICTLIIRSQLNYMQNKKLGFDRDNIVHFMYPADQNDPTLESVKKELSNNPDIVSITRANDQSFNNEITMNGFTWAGKKGGDDILFYALFIDEDFAKTFNLKLKEGRFFSEFPSDNHAVVINEQAAKILGFKNPIGEIITTPPGGKLNIIGVVKDFHYKSLHYKIGPLLIQKGTSNTNLFIRMKPDKITSTIESIKKTVKSFNHITPLNFKFLDDDFDNLYRTEQRMSKIFGYFSFLAIVISCLGLIGLSTFMTERRTKEIGIRKTNGAKSNEIVSLLSKEYTVLVIISFLIACPVAWYAMNKWLQNFAYCTSMSWWVFALAGIIVMFITMLTVGFQSYKAALRNPVDALRHE
jgi:putative ABC transport system permease protein